MEATFDFGVAIDLLREGERVARAGWNGKDMYIYLSKSDDEFVKDSILMRTTDGWHVPWTASQTDILAWDWMLAEE